MSRSGLPAADAQSVQVKLPAATEKVVYAVYPQWRLLAGYRWPYARVHARYGFGKTTRR